MNILFLTQGNSASGPMLSSQGIPHMRTLSRQGFRFTFVTVEASNRLTQDSGWVTQDSGWEEALRRQLLASAIEWFAIYPLHLPFIIPSLSESIACTIRLLPMVVTRKIKIIHARGYFAAMMGLIIKKILGTKLIFDPRDLFLEYKIFEGFLSKSSLKFKISSQLEKTLFSSADAIIVTSEKFREKLASLSYLPTEKMQKVRVVPNCVDTEAFVFSPENRQRIRESLGLCGKIVLIYAGNIGRVRRLKEMSEFVHVMETQVNNLHTLFLTYNNLEQARSMLRECGWRDGALTLSGTSPSKMPGVLSAADVGFGFFDLSYAAIASPIKFAEYLACGLPVIINKGVGDTDRILEKYHAGVIVREWHKEGYYRAAQELLKLLEERDTLRERCRSAAENELSLDCAVERLSGLYRSLLAS